MILKALLEARVGIEPTNKGFADLDLASGSRYAATRNAGELEFCPSCVQIASERYLDTVEVSSSSLGGPTINQQLTALPLTLLSGSGLFRSRFFAGAGGGRCQG